MSVAILIPVDDEDRINEFFENLVDNLDAEIEEDEIADLDGWIFGEESALIHHEHLMMCVPIEPKGDMLDASIDCLEDLVDVEEDSLAQNEHFQAAMTMVEDNWNWLTYTNIGDFGTR